MRHIRQGDGGSVSIVDTEIGLIPPSNYPAECFAASARAARGSVSIVETEIGLILLSNYNLGMLHRIRRGDGRVGF